MAGPYDYYADGDWNARCSMCNQKFKASMLTKNWQGMYRCDKCQEPRHPQDFVKAVMDNPSVPFVQNPDDVFVINSILVTEASDTSTLMPLYPLVTETNLTQIQTES